LLLLDERKNEREETSEAGGNKFTHLVTPPCVASLARKPTGEAHGSTDRSMKKPILVSLILLKRLLKALMLEAPTAR